MLVKQIFASSDLPDPRKLKGWGWGAKASYVLNCLFYHWGSFHSLYCQVPLIKLSLRSLYSTIHPIFSNHLNLSHSSKPSSPCSYPSPTQSEYCTALS